MKFGMPIHLADWIKQYGSSLKPPVNNQVLWQDSDFIVMLVGGPNQRNDYHVNQTEELFYQLKGDIILQVRDENVFKDILIKQGDIFLLPASTPHLPKRPADTIGLVVEQKRLSDQKDGFLWYCENCQALVHSEYELINDIVGQLPQIFTRYFSSEKNRTCQVCGHINAKNIDIAH